MDPIEEKALACAGAQIGTLNRAAWADLCKGRALKDVLWGLGTALAKSGNRQASAQEVAVMLKHRFTEGVRLPPAPIMKVGHSSDTATAILRAIVAQDGIGQHDLPHVSKIAQITVSIWLRANVDLVDRMRIPNTTGTRFSCTLTEKGRVTAMSLGIEVPARPKAQAATAAAAIPASPPESPPQRQTPILENTAVVHQQVYSEQKAVAEVKAEPLQAPSRTVFCSHRPDPAKACVPLRMRLTELIEEHSLEAGFKDTLIEVRAAMASLGIN